jgi:hypothetical protein
VLGGNKKLGDTWKMLRWTLSGKMGGLIGERDDRKSNGNGHSNGHGNGEGVAQSEYATMTAAPKREEEVFRIL